MSRCLRITGESFRIVALSIFSSTFLYASGSNCHTISSGNFFDISNWDCACSPLDCDTLTIEHSVSLDLSTVLEYDLVVIEPGGELTSTADLELRGELVVHGHLEAQRLLTNVPGGMLNDGEIIAQSYFALKAPYTNNGSVTTQDSLWIYSLGNLNNAGSLEGGIVGAGPVCFNHGQIDAPYFTTGYLFNYGSVFVTVADLRTSGLINAGVFEAEHIYAGNNIENEATGSLECDQLLQLGTLGNYGTLRVFGMFYNGNDTAQGDAQLFNGSSTEVRNFINAAGSILRGPGTLCIAEVSENHGTVSGPLGICVVTSGSSAAPFMDVNTGNVAAPVYQCLNTVCATAGLVENVEGSLITVFPQPASTAFVVDLGSLGKAVQKLALYDHTGKEILSDTGPFGEKPIIQRDGIPGGLYLLVGIGHIGQKLFSTSVVLTDD